MNFLEKLKAAVKQHTSCLCVGLDPNLSRIPAIIKKKYADPAEQVVQFLKKVIEITNDFAAAYKPNVGFFEALGPQGLHVFQKVLDFIPDDKIIIADGKRGDISSTAEHYAEAYFEQFNVDAVTINPLMGFETLDPFLQYPEKGLYVLTLTSNPGAKDFLAQPFRQYPSMAAYIAHTLSSYAQPPAADIGMVIGATQPDKISGVLQHHPESCLLIPGIGAQGGSVEGLTKALKNHKGVPLINSSRSILYAGENSADWEKAVAKEAKKYKHILQPITQRYV